MASPVTGWGSGAWTATGVRWKERSELKTVRLGAFLHGKAPSYIDL